MPSDFEDVETDAKGQGGGTRIHATISVDGTVTTKLLPESGELTVGRAASCDLVIPHASVSRHHATLRLAPFEIVDTGSRNGTRLHGKTLATGVAAPLVLGDAVEIGDVAILLQSVPMTFDGKPMLPDVDETPPQAIDAECARSARTRSPFAIVQIATQARANDVLGVLRACLRTTDTVKREGEGFQAILVETGGEQVAIAVARIAEYLRRHGIAAKLGVARYPDDGVVAEQLIAHAHEQLLRDPSAPPSPMDNVRELIRQIAAGDLSVLVAGETGVGKELCAEMIHRLSPRAGMPFVKFNCSALVESLVESELFGHEKGAFTGATSAHPGLLEAGNGGTVFLDEIGELSLTVQSKLLRVLEERLVRRVGGTQGRKIDVRFVCATNRDLAEEVNAGRFRRDLYYRINGVRIAIPPLRERRSEIVPLARAFASRTRPGAPLALGAEVVAALEHHSWPGNIRELRNTIERAVLMSSGGAIRPSHITLDPVPIPHVIRESQPTIPVERISYDRISHERISHETLPGVAMRPSEQSLASEVAELERKRIVETLERFAGNQTAAARALGMSRTTLIARMEEFALRRPRKRD
ncbi:MAG TPA: sigma 54-interacting transcriptional regulator [Kofleriaceae bacterium]|nr:sigma 54-interacting transcriptional regulator [Kofleriaceae bacterium]